MSSDRWLDDDAGPVVRPYTVTRGRTRFREDGLDYITGSWFGVLAPARTPQPIIDLLHANIAEVLKDDALRAKMPRA